MLARAAAHDASKFSDAEKPAFDIALGKLGTAPYGSPEFDAIVAEMGPALAHHYAHNSHHPEHYGEAGIAGMDLFDVIEMLCDWMAAAERVPGQDVDLAHNTRLFGITPQLAAILANTVARWPRPTA
jgi:hypothetical protein